MLRQGRGKGGPRLAERILLKGNEALAEAAILAGCRFFAGYPITPQNEIPAYMAKRMPQVGGVFIQAESELAAINMVYGAAGAGARAMTSSSSPGISLKQEGISYLAGAQLPSVIVNIVRGGPGLGGIQPAQSDYFQATRGGGHGDYRTPVFAPNSVQEMVDLTMEAFEVADAFRNPVLVLGDGILGQMMEPVVLPPPRELPLPPKPWATTGSKGLERRIINSLYLDPAVLEKKNLLLAEKYAQMRGFARAEAVGVEDAEICLVAYGATSRIAKGAVQMARREGIKAGIIRPVTLWPFPTMTIREAAGRVGAFLVVELSLGQMIEDVRLAVEGAVPVHFYGRTGGMVPSPHEILEKLREVAVGLGKRAAAVARAGA